MTEAVTGDFVTPGGGPVITLASRRAEGLMPFPVTDRRATVAAYPSLLTAGADEAEADTAQRIASDPSIIDAERDPLYGDRVKHSDAPPKPYGGPEWREYMKRKAQNFLPQAELDEHIRQSRLSWWQEQR